MKEKKQARKSMANAEQKVRVVTTFRGLRDNDLDLQVGDEVTVFLKVSRTLIYDYDIIVIRLGYI